MSRGKRRMLQREKKVVFLAGNNNKNSCDILWPP